MQSFGYQLFARTALARDQHRGMSGSYAAYLFLDLADGIAPAYDMGTGVILLDCSFRLTGCISVRLFRWIRHS